MDEMMLGAVLSFLWLAILFFFYRKPNLFNSLWPNSFLYSELTLKGIKPPTKEQIEQRTRHMLVLIFIVCAPVTLWFIYRYFAR